MRPDVEGLIGHLKKAEEAGSDGGTLWMSVAEEDALLVEHLQGEEKGTLSLHKRAAGRSQGNVPGIHLSPRLCARHWSLEHLTRVLDLSSCFPLPSHGF